MQLRQELRLLVKGRYHSISNSLSQNRFRFGIFWEPRDYPHPIILLREARILSVEEVLGRSFHPSQNNKQERENYMKKLLLIALMVSGLAFVPVQRSDAQISVGIGGVGIGFGYPGYGYGYYPYGYYRSYPNYGYYTGRSYYGHRVYRHHRHHYYRSRY